MKGGAPKLPPRKFEHRSFKNDNKMEFVNDLSQVHWSVIDGVENVRDAVFLWERLFSEIANEHALLKIKRANPINNIDTCRKHASPIVLTKGKCTEICGILLITRKRI